jgi:hypothetical protein
MAAEKFSVAQASGASISTVLDVGPVHSVQMALRYVTMSTGAEVTVYASDALGGTFSEVHVQEPGTAAAAFNTLVVGTAASAAWAQFVCPPHRYYKFGTSAVVSGGVAYTVVVNDALY